MLYCSQLFKLVFIVSVAVLIFLSVSSLAFVSSFKILFLSFAFFFWAFTSSAFIFFCCSLPIASDVLNLSFFSWVLTFCSSTRSLSALAISSSTATPASWGTFRYGFRTLTPSSPLTSVSRSACPAARTMAATNSVPERMLLSAVFTSPSIFRRWLTALCTICAT